MQATALEELYTERLPVHGMSVVLCLLNRFLCGHTTFLEYTDLFSEASVVPTSSQQSAILPSLLSIFPFVYLGTDHFVSLSSVVNGHDKNIHQPTIFFC